VTHPALDTPFTQLTGVRYPIVQTAMGWVSTARLVAATAEAGGLGLLAVATLDADGADRAIAETQERTAAPFGVSFLMEQPGVERIVKSIVRRGVRVAGYNRAPDPRLIAELKAGGVLCMPSVGALRHATKAVELGADLLIVQGGEGGGHTGSVPTSLLLPQVAAAVDVPVLGAGGFRDGCGLVAALAWGAAGIAMGTRFMLTADSEVPAETKRRYLAAGLDDTVVTRTIDGLPQRVIRTPFVDRLERSPAPLRLVRALQSALAFRRHSGTPIRELARSAAVLRRDAKLSRSQVVMAANAPMLVREALVAGDPDHGVLPTGQVAGVIDDLPTCAELIESIVHTAEQTLLSLADPGAVHAHPHER
jgi:NAD(P)H-dependent flavin oxidoreductase YrpB (nitropropane dioxygenase family)